jgi:hypothetical protein
VLAPLPGADSCDVAADVVEDGIALMPLLRMGDSEPGGACNALATPTPPKLRAAAASGGAGCNAPGVGAADSDDGCDAE